MEVTSKQRGQRPKRRDMTAVPCIALWVTENMFLFQETETAGGRRGRRRKDPESSAASAAVATATSQSTTAAAAFITTTTTTTTPAPAADCSAIWGQWLPTF